MKTTDMLSVSGLKVEFEGHVILDDINFKLRRDGTLAIIGPNGAGKTILFKAMLGLVKFEGKVEWAEDVKIGYVPQKLSVGKDIPLTVAEFLQLKESNPKVIEETIRKAGLGEESAHEPHHKGNRLMRTKLGELSGGELQRVLIVFALLGKPNVLLFDEPTSGVDIVGEETVYALINNLKKEKDLTIIFISHELDVVYKYAETVLCLNKTAVCFGPPKQVIDKQSLEVLYGEEVSIYKHSHHDH